MSVFAKNVCNYCKRNFQSLPDLITHIESEHLDFDPKKMEQLEDEKPDCIPLSYLLRFSAPGDNLQNETENPVIQEIDDVGANEIVGTLNNNYLFDLNLEDSMKPEEFPQLFGGGSHLFVYEENQKKPYLCTMLGCHKRYKNSNGIRYHYKKHHEMIIPLLNKSILKPKLNKAFTGSRFLPNPYDGFCTPQARPVPLANTQSFNYRPENHVRGFFDY